MKLNSTAYNTGWNLLGQIGKNGLQLVSLWLLAKLLTPEQFGGFSAILSLVNILQPYIEMGAYSLIVQDVKHGTPLPRAIGNTLLLSLYSLPLGLLVIILLKFLFLPSLDWISVLMIVLAEFIGQRLYTIGLASNISRDLFWRNAVLDTAFGGLRLLVTVIFIYLPHTLPTWAALYMAQCVAVGTLAVLWIYAEYGKFNCDRQQVKLRLGSGLQFAIGQSAQNSYTDLDKVMLARLGTLADTGIYALAYKVITVAYLPFNSFMSTLYPKYFEHGKTGGLRHTRAFAYKILPISFAYGIVLAGVLYILAPHISTLLGAEYYNTADALRWLSLIPLLQCISFPLADALTGSGRQKQRSLMQILALVLNAILNVWLIPKHGYMGAAWATMLSNSFLCLGLWWACSKA